MDNNKRADTLDPNPTKPLEKAEGNEETVDESIRIHEQKDEAARKNKQ